MFTVSRCVANFSTNWTAWSGAFWCDFRVGNDQHYMEDITVFHCELTRSCSWTTSEWANMLLVPTFNRVLTPLGYGMSTVPLKKLQSVCTYLTKRWYYHLPESFRKEVFRCNTQGLELINSNLPRIFHR